MDKKYLIIRYVHNLGGSFHDNRFREARFEGEGDVYDWNTKENLIHHATAQNIPYKVLRLDREKHEYVEDIVWNGFAD